MCPLRHDRAGQLYSERKGLGVRHKPDARVYADTKSCLVPNYFVVGISSETNFAPADGASSRWTSGSVSLLRNRQHRKQYAIRFYRVLLLLFGALFLPLQNTCGNLYANRTEYYGEKMADSTRLQVTPDNEQRSPGWSDFEEGDSARVLREFDRAEAAYQQAIIKAGRSRDTQLLFRAYMEQGKIPYFKGDYHKAVSVWKKALSLTGASVLRPSAEGRIRANLGAGYIALQYAQSAFKHLSRAYEILKDEPDATPFQLGITRLNIAVALQHMEAYDYAWQILRELEAEVEHPYLKSLVYVNLLVIEVAREEKTQFYRYLDSLYVYEDGQLTGHTLQIIAEGGLAFADWPLVREQLTQIAAVAAADPDVRYIHALPEFEAYFTEQGVLLLDTQLINRCVERNADRKTPRQLYELLHLKSEIAAQQRDWEKAHQWLREADQVGAIWQDSLRSSQFADFAAQYRSSSLKKEVVSLSEELLDRTSELRSNRIITFTLCGLLLGSLGVAFLFLFNLRKARKLAIEEKTLREESKQVAAQKMALLEDELSKKEEKLHFTLTQQLHIRQLFEEAVAFAQNTSGDQDQGRFLNHLKMEQERLRALRQSQDLETELNEQLPVFMARLSERAQEPLTPYEKAVAALIRSGYTTKDIAALLDKSVRAIDNARYRVRQKLGLNRTDHLQSYLEGIGSR